MVGNEGTRLRRVIVSAPKAEYYRVNDPLAHNIGEAAEKTKALDQHRRLIEQMRKFGVRVVNLKELAGHPNSVFTRDSSLVTPEGYVRLRMGLETRRGEENWMAEALESLGIPCAGRIDPPGTLEGGDVILAGRVAFLGCSGRSNRSGVDQLARLLKRMGYEVRVIVLPPGHLHLGGAMSVIGPETVLCCSGLFPEGFFGGFDQIAVPCPKATSANMIALGNGEVIAEKSDSHAGQAVEEAGFIVHRLDLSEFVKGRGGPTCLILPIDRE